MVRAAALFLVGYVSVGCSQLEQPPPKPQFDIEVRVTGDGEEPVKGARVVFQSAEVGLTDEQGKSRLRLEGREGERFAIRVKCPKGFKSPEKPIEVTLRKIVGEIKRPRYNAECLPNSRTVVVAVRAENGANLPVTYLGKEVARTDAAGAAHVMLELEPRSQFQLMLDTSGVEGLMPENPSASFEVPERDEVFVFDQKFTVKQRRIRYRPRPKAPSGPTPL